MFNTIFTTTTDGSINMAQAAIAIGAAFIIGFIIAAVYMFMCKNEGYQKNFIIGLAILPAVVAVVILLVSYFSPWQPDLHADLDMYHLQQYLLLLCL